MHLLVGGRLCFWTASSETPPVRVRIIILSAALRAEVRITSNDYRSLSSLHYQHGYVCIIIYTDICVCFFRLLLFFFHLSKMRSRSDELEVIQTEMVDARNSKS